LWDWFSFVLGFLLMDVIGWFFEHRRNLALEKEKIWFEKREYSRKA